MPYQAWVAKILHSTSTAIFKIIEEALKIKSYPKTIMGDRKIETNKTWMASKNSFEELFGIVTSNFKTVCNCRIICYYDAKGIIWSAFAIYYRLKILISVNLAYYIILSYTIGKGIVISFFISHLVRSKFTFYWFSIFWFVSMKKWIVLRNTLHVCKTSIHFQWMV